MAVVLLDLVVMMVGGPSQLAAVAAAEQTVDIRRDLADTAAAAVVEDMVAELRQLLADSLAARAAVPVVGWLDRS